jgi:hypothetical protein
MKAGNEKNREMEDRMKRTGKTIYSLFFLAAAMLSANTQAALTASVDRDRVTMGDILKLTIAATDNEPINNIDLRPLLKDFEILQRASSSSTNVTNGEVRQSRTVIMDISPKREGTLRIPSLQAGRFETNYLLIAVGPATTSTGDPLISFTAELDTERVYVQGQALLTLRIQQAINLDSRSITELQLDNAFVKQLEQKSFQRTIDGRPWLVHEIRYAIFPEQSGTLTIPGQTFSARESMPRRGMFDIGGTGRPIKRTSDALTIKVLPRPAGFPGQTWLPASNLEIKETWSIPPEQLRVGESATRRITLSGEGLQGAQLPPVFFPATDGLKYYPDQPVISDSESSSGLAGSREDSAALVPTKEGSWDIPEIRIPWWDTDTDEIRYAILPARKVQITASLEHSSAPLNIPAPTANPTFDASPIAVTPGTESSGPWKIIAILTTLGWLLTTAFFLLRQRIPRPAKTASTENPSEAAAFRQLLAACTTGNAPQARRWLIKWTAALLPQDNVHSLDQVEAIFADAELTSQLEGINNSLYSQLNAGWDGQGLALLAKRLRKSHSSGKGSAEAELRLYPA